MLREAAFDDFVEPVILVAVQEAKATDSLATVANLPCRIDGGFAVVDALSVTERDEGLVAVGGGGRLAVGAEPTFELLRGDLCGGARAEGLADDLGFADVAATVLVVKHVRDAIISFIGDKKNGIISGGTGSGKTTLLKAFLDHIPQQERLLVIEQPAELKIAHHNAIRWEAVDEIPGQVAVTPSGLLAAALRHRPDRIIMGEIRNECGYGA